MRYATLEGVALETQHRAFLAAFADAPAKLGRIPNVASHAVRGAVTYVAPVGADAELRVNGWANYIGPSRLGIGPVLGAILGLIGIVRIVVWQKAGFYDYGPHWALLALTIGCALTAIVTFDSLTGSMLPFILKKVGFDPAFGARPLKRVIQREIGDTLAMALLQGTYGEGDTVVVDADPEGAVTLR